MPSPKLKPCPVCHTEPPDVSVFWWDCEDTTQMFSHYVTICNDCGFRYDGGAFSVENAVAAWNRRAGEETR